MILRPLPLTRCVERNFKASFMKGLYVERDADCCRVGG